MAQRAADTGINFNVDPSIPDALIVAMDPNLDLAGVRAYLLNEGEKFKLSRDGDELSIAAAERLG